MSGAIVYESGTGLYINLTNRCPCDCVFCVRKKTDGINANESLWLTNEPTYDEIIDEIEKRDASAYSEIVFCGFGEPTERLDDMISIAKHIKNKHPKTRIRLNTNGLSDLINRKSTAKSLAENIDSASISLNASNEEDYLKICRPVFGRESFEAMISFAMDCKKHFNEVCFTIIDSPNDVIIEECKRLCEKLGVRLRIRANI